MNTRSPRPLIRLALAAALAAAVFPALARAAPRDELLRLVPDDVAFCLVVQDLRQHSQALAASPFAEAFRKSPFAAGFKDSPEFKKLAQLDAELRKQVASTPQASPTSSWATLSSSPTAPTRPARPTRTRESSCCGRRTRRGSATSWSASTGRRRTPGT